jgi:hypothetical protein
VRVSSRAWPVVRASGALLSAMSTIALTFLQLLMGRCWCMSRT